MTELSLSVNDARKCNAQTQEQLRLQAVRLRNKGVSNQETAEIVGVHLNTTSKWWQDYLAGGMNAIKSKKRGIAKGTNRILNPKDEKHIQQLLVDKSPDQFKLDVA